MIKFQDELALKDKQLTELQTSSKKKQLTLETQMKVDLKKFNSKISKLNSRLNKADSIVKQ